MQQALLSPASNSSDTFDGHTCQIKFAFLSNHANTNDRPDPLSNKQSRAAAAMLLYMVFKSTFIITLIHRALMCNNSFAHWAATRMRFYHAMYLSLHIGTKIHHVTCRQGGLLCAHTRSHDTPLWMFARSLSWPFLRSAWNLLWSTQFPHQLQRVAGLTEAALVTWSRTHLHSNAPCSHIHRDLIATTRQKERMRREKQGQVCLPQHP